MKQTLRRITVGLITTSLITAVCGIAGAAQADEPGVRLIVGYKSGTATDSFTRKLSGYGALGNADQTLAKINAQEVTVPASASASTVAQLQADPNVAYVQRDLTRTSLDVTPTDPDYQYVQSEYQQVNVPSAWDTTTGSAITIAVVDTGVNAGDDLAGAVLPGYNEITKTSNTADDNGHGSLVAGLIAGRGNNGAASAGVCWACKILPVKVLDSSGSGYDSDIAAGIVYAVDHGAKIVNLSLGGPGSSSALTNAVAYASAHSVLVVAAAGNNGDPNNASATEQPMYPAAIFDVLSVGAAVTGGNTPTDYTSQNSPSNLWVDVAAPGDVYYEQGGSLYKEDGTSFASPIVAGIAGLVLTQHPSFDRWSLQYAIMETATPVPGKWASWGQVNAANALTKIPDTTPPTITGASPNAWTRVRGTVTLPVTATDSQSGVRDVNLFVGPNQTLVNTDWASPWAPTWNTAGYYGPVTVSWRAQDHALNYGPMYSRVLVADNVAPLVSFTSGPKNGSTISGTVREYFKATDQWDVRSIQLLVNGAVVAATSPTVNTTLTGSLTFNASKYKGTVYVQFRTYDMAGNAGLSPRYTYHR